MYFVSIPAKYCFQVPCSIPKNAIKLSKIKWKQNSASFNIFWVSEKCKNSWGIQMCNNEPMFHKGVQARKQPYWNWELHSASCFWLILFAHTLDMVDQMISVERFHMEQDEWVIGVMVVIFNGEQYFSKILNLRCSSWSWWFQQEESPANA